MEVAKPSGDSDTHARADLGTQADPWGLGPGGEGTAYEPPAAGRPASSASAKDAGQPRSPRRTQHQASSRGVDLEQLVGQDTPLFWFEAVAIVRELCDVLLAARRTGAAAGLEPRDVTITAAGGVDVRSGAATGLPAVADVAHILLTLLGEAQTLPVQLRLLALQEVSPTRRDTTLAAWSGTLAAFERPGRQRTIQDVYERFMQLPARDGDTPVKELARPARERKDRHRWWRSRRVRQAAVSVVLLVAAGIAAVWLWPLVAPMLSGTGSSSKQKADAGPAPQSLSAAAVERIREVARRIWLAAEPGPPAAAPDVAPDANSAPAPTPAEVASLPAAAPAPELRAPDAPAAAMPASAEQAVFSAGDASVVPPILLRPRLPMNPRPGVRAEVLPQVEILVSPAGEVESVKLLTQPAGVIPTMMLSAIKTWRFEPATRDGRPVRYRLLMRLTNQ